ncbi:MAG: hypothetical protein ABH849_00625 [Nanoarchaeota archaeon]
MKAKTISKSKAERKKLILDLKKELRELEELLSLNWYSPESYRFGFFEPKGKRK